NDARSDALRPRDARPSVVTLIRRDFARQVREAGRARLIEKTPSNALRLGFVDAVLPGSVYLHVMRSGVESVLSIRDFWDKHAAGVGSVKRKLLWQRLREMRPTQAPHYAKEFARRALGTVAPKSVGPPVWGPRPPGISEMARDLDPLEVCAWQWRMCVEHTCTEGRKLPPDRYTEFRLEEVDEALLVRLMEFAGLAPSDEVLESFRARFDASKPSGRSKQGADADVERARELVAPTEAWLATLPSASRH
ncbi:MAG: hypothetical protein AAGG46_01210, partial [Planctomycetota bacterium]